MNSDGSSRNRNSLSYWENGLESYLAGAERWGQARSTTMGAAHGSVTTTGQTSWAAMPPVSTSAPQAAQSTAFTLRNKRGGRQRLASSLLELFSLGQVHRDRDDALPRERVEGDLGSIVQLVDRDAPLGVGVAQALDDLVAVSVGQPDLKGSTHLDIVAGPWSRVHARDAWAAGLCAVRCAAHATRPPAGVQGP